MLLSQDFPLIPVTHISWLPSTSPDAPAVLLSVDAQGHLNLYEEVLFSSPPAFRNCYSTSVIVPFSVTWTSIQDAPPESLASFLSYTPTSSLPSSESFTSPRRERTVFHSWQAEHRFLVICEQAEGQWKGRGLAITHRPLSGMHQHSISIQEIEIPISSDSLADSWYMDATISNPASIRYLHQCHLLLTMITNEATTQSFVFSSPITDSNQFCQVDGEQRCIGCCRTVKQTCISQNRDLFLVSLDDQNRQYFWNEFVGTKVLIDKIEQQINHSIITAFSRLCNDNRYDNDNL